MAKKKKYTKEDFDDFGFSISDALKPVFEDFLTQLSQNLSNISTDLSKSLSQDILKEGSSGDFGKDINSVVKQADLMTKNLMSIFKVMMESKSEFSDKDVKELTPKIQSAIQKENVSFSPNLGSLMDSLKIAIATLGESRLNTPEFFTEFKRYAESSGPSGMNLKYVQTDMESIINQALSKIDIDTSVIKEKLNLFNAIDLSTIKGPEDASKILKNVDETIKKINKNGLIISDDVGSKIKSALVEYLSLVSDTVEKSSKMADNITSGFDWIFNKIENMPFGKAFSELFELKDLRDRIHKNITSALVHSFKDGEKASILFKEVFKNGLTSIAHTIKAIAKNWKLLVPLVMLAGIVSIYKAWKRIQDATKELIDQTGLLYDTSRKLTNNAIDISAEYAHLGVNLGVATKATGALVNEFQTASLVTKDMVETVALLDATLGLAPETGAKFLRVMKTIGNLSDSQVKSTAGFVKNLSLAAGVAPARVMQDIAESSETIYKFMSGNVTEIAKAAVEARRMGLSLKDMGGMASGLLDWDTSITSAIEASTLLGKSLDFSRARGLAFMGDMKGMGKEVFNQIKQVGDFERMNVFQREALAKAVGLSVEQLGQSLKQQKLLNELSAYQRLEYEQIEKSMSALTKDNAESLLNDQRRALVTERFSQAWDKISMAAMNFVDSISPFIEWVIGGATELLTLIGSIFGGTTSSQTVESVKALDQQVQKASISSMAMVGVLASPILLKAGQMIKSVGTSIWEIGKGAKNAIVYVVDLIKNMMKAKSIKTAGSLMDSQFGDVIPGAGKSKPKLPSTDKGPGTLSKFGESLGKIKPAQLLAVGAALMMVAGAVWILSKAMQEMSKIDPERFGQSLIGLGVGITVLAGVMVLMAALAPVIGTASLALLAMGAAMVLVAGSVWILSKAMQELAKIKGDDLADTFSGIGTGIYEMVTNAGFAILALPAFGLAAMAAAPGLTMLSIAMTGLSIAFNIFADGIEKIVGAIRVLSELKDMSSDMVSNIGMAGDAMISFIGKFGFWDGTMAKTILLSGSIKDIAEAIKSLLSINVSKMDDNFGSTIESVSTMIGQLVTAFATAVKDIGGDADDIADAMESSGVGIMGLMSGLSKMADLTSSDIGRIKVHLKDVATAVAESTKAFDSVDNNSFLGMGGGDVGAMKDTGEAMKSFGEGISSLQGLNKVNQTLLEEVTNTIIRTVKKFDDVDDGWLLSGGDTGAMASMGEALGELGNGLLKLQGLKLDVTLTPITTLLESIKGMEISDSISEGLKSILDAIVLSIERINNITGKGVDLTTKVTPDLSTVSVTEEGKLVENEKSVTENIQNNEIKSSIEKSNYNKQIPIPTVNVENKNDELVRKLDQLINVMSNISITMDGKKVGSTISSYKQSDAVGGTNYD